MICTHIRTKSDPHAQYIKCLPTCLQGQSSHLPHCIKIIYICKVHIHKQIWDRMHAVDL